MRVIVTSESSLEARMQQLSETTNCNDREFTHQYVYLTTLA